MDPPSLKQPATPGMPLFPLSPERVNGARPPYDGKVPQSPSLPDFAKGSGIDPSSVFLNHSISTSTPPSQQRHTRNNSEVYVGSMVARFDALSIRDYKQRDEVAIKRVEMAREMAELERDRLKGELKECVEESRKYKEDVRRTKRELEECKERERKVMKRLDVVMEELQRAKENHNLAVGIYEKEIRRTKKEAFKSGSGVVKLQEELRAVRASLNVVKANLETEKGRSARKEQDAFSAQYQLVGIQEELQRTQERLKVIEEERDTLKTSLKEEELARIAAEGQLALPNDEDEDLLASPTKSPRKPSPVDGEDKENVMPRRKSAQAEMLNLHDELILERRLRERAEEQIDFMKMECQFRCCSCRLAERQGTDYVHDDSFRADMERIKQEVPVLTTVVDGTMDLDTDQTLVAESQNERRQSRRKTEMLISFSSPKPRTSATADVMVEEEPTEKAGDLPEAAHPADLFEALAEQGLDEGEEATASSEEDDDALFSTPPQSAVEEPREEIRPPQTPMGHEFRTVTTITTVPIHFNSPFPTSDAQQPTTPMTIGHPPTAPALSSLSPSKALRPDGTLDREAALEQIRQRRGRARSMAIGYGTPQKQMIEGVDPNGRRDISAPALRAWTKG